jgi:hypothetical protein
MHQHFSVNGPRQGLVPGCCRSPGGILQRELYYIKTKSGNAMYANSCIEAWNLLPVESAAMDTAYCLVRYDLRRSVLCEPLHFVLCSNTTIPWKPKRKLNAEPPHNPVTSGLAIGQQTAHDSISTAIGSGEAGAVGNYATLSFAPRHFGNRVARTGVPAMCNVST